MTSYLEVSEPRPHVRQLTLNRPERMNAMSFDTVTPLRDAPGRRARTTTPGS